MMVLMVYRILHPSHHPSLKISEADTRREQQVVYRFSNDQNALLACTRSSDYGDLARELAYASVPSRSYRLARAGVAFV